MARPCQPSAASLVAVSARSWSCAAAVACAISAERAEPAARSGSLDDALSAAASTRKVAALAGTGEKSDCGTGIKAPGSEALSCRW